MDLLDQRYMNFLNKPEEVIQVSFEKIFFKVSLRDRFKVAQVSPLE